VYSFHLTRVKSENKIYDTINIPMDTVSVIIPTYNRFKYLLNLLESVKKQTYPNVEIIAVNDNSSHQEYYNYDWDAKGVKIIHLDQNSKELFGYACAGFVRNKGIEVASGKYIAFCDDDDIWFPEKLELQIKAMKKYGCKMSSTEGLIGNGEYDPSKTYKRYNSEENFNTLQNIYRRRGSTSLDNGFPKIWDLDFLRIHNCVICSSVVIEKCILDKIHNMKNVRNGQEDYDCWLRALNHTDSVYVDEICFYYDNGHGDGQNY